MNLLFMFLSPDSWAASAALPSSPTFSQSLDQSHQNLSWNPGQPWPPAQLEQGEAQLRLLVGTVGLWLSPAGATLLVNDDSRAMSSLPCLTPSTHQPGVLVRTQGRMALPGPCEPGPLDGAQAQLGGQDPGIRPPGTRPAGATTGH